MASPIQFPKAQHVALSTAEHPVQATADARARDQASEALLFPAGAVLPAGAVFSAGAGPAAAEPAKDAAVSEAPADSAKTPPRLPRMISVDLSLAGTAHETCAGREGARTEAASGTPIRCVSSTEGRGHAGALAALAAAQGEAIAVEGLDRWYRLGPERAGFCRSCELALVEAVRESYGEHVQQWDPLAALRLAGGRERPFAGLRERQRLGESIDFVKRSVLHARDDARKNRGEELLIFGRIGPLSGLGLLLCRHLDGLIFELPTTQAAQCILPLIAARAALGQRAGSAVPPPSVTATEVTLLGALATACGVDLLLPEGASPEAHAALAQQRRFFGLVRERYRATEPLLDAEILVSPLVDHWTQGGHLRAATLCTAVLSSAHIQVGARLSLEGPAAGRPKLWVLAGCEALTLEQAALARRHVESGGDLLLFGRAAAIDDEGRPGEPIFLDAKAGPNRIGEGRLYFIESEGPGKAAAGGLEQKILRGARELLGRGRTHLTLSGRGQIFARAYLDPERKLDLHLVNLDLREGQLVPSQGALLHIAGQAAGAGRTGYWFAPERDGGRDGERISLNPSGFSVSTVLPSFTSASLLAVPR